MFSKLNWRTFSRRLTPSVSSSDSSSTTIPWTVSSNDSTITDSLTLYIVPTSGSFTQVGFYESSNSSTYHAFTDLALQTQLTLSSPGSTLPTGAVTTGFTLFGASLAYQATDGSLELQFWAQATNTTGVWELIWNAGGEGGESVDGLAITPVTLKTMAPIVLTNT